MHDFKDVLTNVDFDYHSYAQFLSNLPIKCDFNFMTVDDDLKFFEQIQLYICFNVRDNYSQFKF